MTLRTLRALVQFWKPLLEIAHWNISCAWGTQADVRAKDEEFLYGRVLTAPERDAAGIVVFRCGDLAKAEEALGIDLLDGKSFDQLYEETIIHELLHVRLDPREKLAGDSAFETGLDATAAALYKLRHGIK